MGTGLQPRLRKAGQHSGEGVGAGAPPTETCIGAPGGPPTLGL